MPHKLIVNPDKALRYALDVIKGPWPEGEVFIKNDLSCSATYAVFCLKQRWPEIEPKLIKNIFFADHYIDKFFVDKRERWSELEEYILNDVDYFCKLEDLYSCNIFIDYLDKVGLTFEPYKPHFLKISEAIIYLCQKQKNSRWYEGEKAFLDNISLNTKYFTFDDALYYAEYIIRGRWIELEERYPKELLRNFWDYSAECIKDEFLSLFLYRNLKNKVDNL